MSTEKQARVLYDYSVEGVHGLKDKEGNIVLPAIYDSFISFNDAGLAKVEKNKKFGFIDSDLNLVIPLVWDEARYACNFKPDVILVKKKGKWGILNAKGEVIIPVEYSEVSAYNGFLWVSNKIKCDGYYDVKHAVFDTKMKS